MSDDCLFRVYSPSERHDNDGYPWPWAHGDEFWSPIKELVREEAGNRCVRCGHPYTKGQHPMERDPRTFAMVSWSPCDEHCTHLGPVRLRDLNRDEPWAWNYYDLDVIGQPAGQGIFDEGIAGPYRRYAVEARARILTTHHLNGNKSDCRWWNLAPLCQRCHLTIQGKVKMDRPYDRPHSAWFLPYVGGHYAAKYLGEELTRDEVMARIDELLALELRQDALFVERGTIVKSTVNQAN